MATRGFADEKQCLNHASQLKFTSNKVLFVQCNNQCESRTDIINVKQRAKKAVKLLKNVETSKPEGERGEINFNLTEESMGEKWFGKCEEPRMIINLPIRNCRGERYRYKNERG